MQGDGVALFSGSGGGAALLVDALSRAQPSHRHLERRDQGQDSPTFLPADAPSPAGRLRRHAPARRPAGVPRRRPSCSSACDGRPDVGAGIVLLTTQPDHGRRRARDRGRSRRGLRQAAAVRQRRRQGRARRARGDARRRSYPAFDHPVDAVRVVAALVERLRSLRTTAAPAALEPIALDGHAGGAAARPARTKTRAKRLLAAAGVPVTRERLARDADEAVRLAAEIGFPVVLKAQARALSHKSDVGGVVLNLAYEAAVQSRVRGDRRARAALRRAPSSTAAWCRRWSKADAELIVGAQLGRAVRRDAAGRHRRHAGRAAEGRAARARADRRRSRQRSLLRSLKLAPLLAGYRGKPPVDLDAVGAVHRAHQPARRQPRPAAAASSTSIRCSVAGNRAIVADARAVLAEGPNPDQERP